MDKIIVLDFGGQYTQLIAKRVRQTKVFSEIMPYDIDPKELADAKGIIFSGGPDSVYEDNAPTVAKEIFELGIPVLGICYGMQLMVHVLGGKIISGKVKEYGATEVEVVKNDSFFKDLKNFSAWMSHGDSADADSLPDGFILTAKTKSHTAAVADPDKRLYGVQFHPEVTHSEKGQELIDNFVHEICGCEGTWNMSSLITDSMKYVQDTVGENDIICFVSGGVDSTYVAALLKKTKGIGKVYNIYIEALMREGETREIVAALSEAGIDDLIVYKAEAEFIEALEGIKDPEEKRKTIGNLFGKIQGKVIEDLGLSKENTFLAQGTLYTDMIESGKGVGDIAANIKSHHNVGCEFIEDLKKRGRIVEPNRLIFKDEVRKAAQEIGLPEKIYSRQPFPGPGLAIRIVDSVEMTDDFDEIAEQVAEIASDFGYNGYITPIRTVGVQGDFRTYSYLGVLSGPKDWKKIREAANAITTKVHDVNRIVYHIGSGSNGVGNGDSEELTQEDFTNTIETRVTKSNVDLLKLADSIGRQVIGNEKVISQTAIILFALDLYGDSRRAIALRSAMTDDFMTITPPELGKEIPWETISKLKEKLVGKQVSSLFYDVTDKPPSTFCWE